MVTCKTLFYNFKAFPYPCPPFYLDFPIHLIDLDEIYRLGCNLAWTDMNLNEISVMESSKNVHNMHLTDSLPQYFS